MPTVAESIDVDPKTSVAGVDREFDAELIEQVPDTSIEWSSLDGTSHNGWVRSDLKRFKDGIEHQGHPDGGWRGTIVKGEA